MKEYSSPQERALNALFCYTGIIMNEENVERDTRQRRKWCKTDWMEVHRSNIKGALEEDDVRGNVDLNLMYAVFRDSVEQDSGTEQFIKHNYGFRPVFWYISVYEHAYVPV